MTTVVDKSISRSTSSPGGYLLVLLGLSSLSLSSSTGEGNDNYIKEERAGVHVSRVDNSGGRRRDQVVNVDNQRRSGVGL